jgi:hypothetical protein
LDLNRRKKKRLQSVQAYSKLFYKKKLKAVVHNQWRQHWLKLHPPGTTSERDVSDDLMLHLIDTPKDIDYGDINSDDSDDEDNNGEDDGDDDIDVGDDHDSDGATAEIPPVPLNFRNHIIAMLWASADDDVKEKVERYREREYARDNDWDPSEEGMDPIVVQQKKATMRQQYVL